MKHCIKCGCEFEGKGIQCSRCRNFVLRKKVARTLSIKREEGLGQIVPNNPLTLPI
jgi:hypothetical protein